MSRHYISHEEDEAYREGKHDERRHSRTYKYDKYSEEPNDVAYFHGREDEAHNERRREEEKQLEEEQERQQKIEYERYLEEREYYDQMLSDEQINREIEELSNDFDIFSENDNE
jgi:hypothetical protein